MRDELLAQAMRELGEPEPRPLADVLDDVLAAFRRYVVFPSVAAAYAVVLWVAATHAQSSWQHATRLVVKSPTKRCAKSRLLDLIAATCHRPLVTVNASVAAVFRSIDPADPPTLIIDEADAVFGKKAQETTEELRGLLNAGFQRNRPTLRCVGPQQTPTEFPTYAMAALAAIGDVIPDTITDRAAVVTLQRRTPAEEVSPYRDRRDAAPLRALGAELHAAVREHLDDLTAAEPVMPVEDRAADTWESLFAIAHLAGGAWPERAHVAVLAMTSEADTAAADAELGLKLLADVRSVFAEVQQAALSSEDLVYKLRALPESPWFRFDLTQNTLANKLRPYNVRPDRVRPDGPDARQVRGYELEWFAHAFAAYLPDPPSQAVEPSQAQVRPVTVPDVVTPQGVTDTQGVTGLTRDYDALTACDTPSGGNGAVPEHLLREFGARVLTDAEIDDLEDTVSQRWVATWGVSTLPPWNREPESTP